MRHTTPGRRGFTLIELMVVLGIILTLAALTVAFAPRVAERAKTTRGANQLSQWLLVAKQWAKRDRVPTGIRLKFGQTMPNTANPNQYYVTDVDFIQQPGSYYPPGATIQLANGQTQIIQGLAGGSAFDWIGGGGIQAGDYLELKTGSPVYQIIQVTSTNLQANPVVYDRLVLSRSFELAAGQTTAEFRIIRGPRVLIGEPSLQLPQDVVIDATTNSIYANPLPSSSGGAGVADIVFAPSGEVIGAGTSTEYIALWVRDATLDSTSPGEQVLAVVYVRTGFVTTQPVDTSVNTVSNTQVSPGVNVTITVANSAGIFPGTSLIVELGGANQERQVVSAVNGNKVTFKQLQLAHPSSGGPPIYAVVSDPYNFVRDGRSSGL